MPLTSAQKVAAYRARQKDKGLEDTTRRNRKFERKAWKHRRPSASRNKPFVGCDGEGAGTDDLGRQLYLLFRMGERELFTGSHLRTEELLEFICDEPANTILVGFAFGYDVTMILRDLSPRQQERLFAPKVFGAGFSPFVWYKNFDIEYLPKNYLKVRRTRTIRLEDGSEKREVIKGSTRVIYETFGFFQKSFLKVLHEFDVGTPEERERIARNKDRRGDFTGMDTEEREYCALECVFLAELMEKLRDYCTAAGIIPRTWSGAGKLASALHAKHDTPKRSALSDTVPEEVESYANMAYYGGRFEITRTGMIDQPVYENDIRSAYPAAMPQLPCLVHGTWKKAKGAALGKCDGLFVAAVTFKCKPAGGANNFGQMGGFPVRSKEGHLFWPLQGAGVYWSPEIRSAEAMGFKVGFKEGWIYEKRCDCKVFEWVEELYDYRRSIGSSGPGYPIKLGINSLYGKIAQRRGNGVYHNMVWAGLITALTRTKLNTAIAHSVERHGHGRILMVATDALYSLDPLDELEVGERLGQWEAETLEGLFIVQPGLYWCPALRKKKSRGLSGKFFEQRDRTLAFEQRWSDYQAALNSNADETVFPAVTVPVPGFIGLKLAVSRGKPEKAGCWVEDTREISFDWRNKRVGCRMEGGAAITKPKLGGRDCVSLPHRDFLKAGGAEPWEALRLVLDEQPDYVDFGIPFKD